MNRWLNPDLVAASATRPKATIRSMEAICARGTVEGQTTPTALRVGVPGVRSRKSRVWQRLAAGMLLTGSAAFSYVAWSDTPAWHALVDFDLASLKTAVMGVANREDATIATPPLNQETESAETEAKVRAKETKVGAEEAGAQIELGTETAPLQAQLQKQHIMLLRQENQMLNARVAQLQTALAVGESLASAAHRGTRG